MENYLKKFWGYLKKDTWHSWVVSMLLLIILIKFIFFPVLGLVTQTSLPIVIIESCSMYHESSFDDWWSKNQAWYESRDINKSDFESFSFKNGLNKGDIIFLIGKEEYKIGDIIIFKSETKYPIIHRVIAKSPISTKGDHNTAQLAYDKNIRKTAIIGKSAVKIPLAGWLKLIFFEPFRPASERGFCQ